MLFLSSPGGVGIAPTIERSVVIGTDVPMLSFPRFYGCYLSVEVALHARLQNRTCRFRVIRLLNDMVLVMNTCLGMVCMPLIMAVPMKRTFVAEFVPSACAFGNDVIDLYVILIFEEESTPTAFSLLFLEEFAQRSTQHCVFFESCTPVEEVAVIWACRPSHFGVALNRSSIMPSQHVLFLVLENPA